MVGNFRPEDVADAFVKQYYLILNKSPENVHKFYQDGSIQGWQGSDNVVVPVTTLSEINKKVMASDYKHCSAEIKTIDYQQSIEGGIIVSVTGCFTRTDNVKKNFTQTFFLAKQERGFYVLNDILRLFDVCQTTANEILESANSDVDDDKNSDPSNTADSLTSLDSKEPVENGKIEESADHSVSKDILANGVAPSPSPAVDERVVSPPKEQSVVAPAKNPIMRSVNAPAQTPRVPSVFTPPSNITPKVTYASMVAKETMGASPKATTVAVNAPTTKVTAPLGNGSLKVSIPNGTVSKAVTSSGKVTPKSPRGSQGTISKAVTSSGKVTPKSPRGGQGAVNAGPYPEGRGIYIGGLPYNITKQGVVDVVKKFGPVRRYSDTVQIRRHEDGFCCAFVEFESPDSARRAVEAHFVMFDEKEAYITYKRSSYNWGNGGGARSPTRGKNRNDNSRDQARGPRRSASAEQPRQGGRDRLK